MTPLATLLSHPSIWRGNQLGTVSVPSLSTGFCALDAELPGGGWPVATLTEILPEHEGIGEIRLLGHALANLSARGCWIAWIAPPYVPYAPALKAAGIDLDRFFRVNTRSLRETLWAMEQALRDNSCGAVIAWPEKVSYPDLRRLQLAAAGSQALAVLFRPLRTATESSPAALRLRLQTYQGDLAIRIVKRRGHAFTRLIVLRPASVICPRKPVVFNHVVARAPLPVTAPRIVTADLSAV
jgi:cell division inhibitor SulA/protein ImuA